MAKRSQAVLVAVLMSMGLLTLLVYGARGEAVPLEAPGQGRRLSSVRHCKTDDLPSLPIPSLEWLTAQLPTPDELRPRFASVEELFRHVPFWHPVAAEDILPIADSTPKKDVLFARRCNAIVLALVTVSLGVALASLPVALANRLTMMRYSRLASPNSNGEELPLSGKDAEPTTEPIEMELGPVRTMLFAAYYFVHNATLMVLTSYSMTHNLMLGALGIDWEMLWLWLVGVLTADVISYTLRAVEAAYHGRVLALPVTGMVMSVLPVLGPRVDLLKDCLFAASAFQLAACAEKQSTQHVGFAIGCLALLTIFLPAPFLFYNGHTRRDLAAEFLPAIVARATEPAEASRPKDRADLDLPLQELLLKKAAPKLVAQCTDARLRTGLAEDLPQAVLALWAMFVFNKFSGLLLFSFVICTGKIAAVFSLRWFLWEEGLHVVDPVSCLTFLASYHSDLPLKERLDQRGETMRWWGGTSLHLAARDGHAATAAALCSAGADKEACDDFGQTPLHLAAYDGYPDVVKVLLDAGADKEAKDNKRLTPLHWAAERGSAEAVAALLAAGADKEGRDGRYGNAPLHCAAKQEHLHVVKLLLDAGAAKEAEDNGGQTPLHLAANDGYPDVVKVLLDAGADKDVKDRNGRTPLQRAAACGHPDVVKVLLDAGADKEVTNKDGKKSLDWLAGWKGWGGTEEQRAACRQLLG